MNNEMVSNAVGFAFGIFFGFVAGHLLTIVAMHIPLGQ